MNTIMKWKGSVGKGWEKIVEEAIEDIEKHRGFVVQVKEKFGELRIYTQGGDLDMIDTIIHDAEMRSRFTCEECGNSGQLAQLLNGILKNLCPDCYKQLSA